MKNNNQSDSWQTYVPYVINPKYWPIWCGFLFAWCFNFVPLFWQGRLAKGLGWCLFYLPTAARSTAEINISICFPELSVRERRQILKQYFQSLVLSVFELNSGFWSRPERFKEYYRIQGLEHLLAAEAEGKGVILLGTHMLFPDVGGQFLRNHVEVQAMVRTLKNPLAEKLLKRIRGRYVDNVIPQNNIKAVVRLLKAKKIVWHAADLELGQRSSLFVPLMGITALTSTSTSRLAEVTGAKVVPSFAYRKPDGYGYCIEILPAIDNFPTDDQYQDALRINQFIETAIRKQPAAYFWQYRRFEQRPPGEQPIYFARKRKRRVMKPATYERIFKEGKLISENKRAIVLQMPEPESDYMIKFIRVKRSLTSTEIFITKARKFVKNCMRLAKRGVLAPVIKRYYIVPGKNFEAVVYKKIAGDTVREMLLNRQADKIFLAKLARFIAELHRKGIYFRGLHAGNIVWQNTSERFGLIDITDISFSPCSLSFFSRLRNFKPLLRYAEDILCLTEEELVCFFTEYAKASELSEWKTRRLLLRAREAFKTHARSKEKPVLSR